MSEPYEYEATKVDATTWMVKRYPDNKPWDEQLLTGMPPDLTAEQAIQEAVKRWSWA